MNILGLDATQLNSINSFVLGLDTTTQETNTMYSTIYIYSVVFNVICLI